MTAFAFVDKCVPAGFLIISDEGHTQAGRGYRGRCRMPFLA
jgi:hypothetical protein